ncbi:MAG: hypothetical protein HY868_08515 [Chloroflexi bacterium]|nr:hypothetical protein [Chloroflexota bacterium]
MKTAILLALVVVALLFGAGAWQAWRRSATEDVAKAKPIAPTAAPRGPLAPEIASNTWLNSAPLAPNDLRGHVVVVEFWTFG